MTGDRVHGRQTDAPRDVIRDRGWLPHLEVPGGIYFVTFRLTDSLPARVVEEIRRERRRLVAACAGDGRSPRPDEIFALSRAERERVEASLDGGHGKCCLWQTEVAEMVARALEHFQCKRYYIGAWTVMPNHVHVILRPVADHTLSAIMHAWKSYTAHAANEILSRSGTFWQHEYYDHLVRNRAELQHCTEYVLANPERAGLRNWPWVAKGDLGPDLLF
jgi:REP element-mobilizing transposase RayT